MKTQIRKNAVGPFSVSYHGDSTILIDSKGHWASGQIPRDQAEIICAEANSLPLEHCQEYDNAAEWCARRNLKGDIGDPLPANMDADGALKFISADPEAFQARVRQFAYMLAMESAR